jgi:hypothetical protein
MSLSWAEVRSAGAAALAFAQRGASVVLFEANPKRITAARGANGCILRVSRCSTAWESTSPPRRRAPTPVEASSYFRMTGPRRSFLPYPDGMQGVSLEHENLVSLVRIGRRHIEGVD